MKKIALIFCFSALFLTGLSAQDSDFQKVRFGFQASPTWSWLRTNDNKIEGVGSNWGAKLGVMTEFYFARNYAFTTGLGFGFNHGGFLRNGYYSGNYWPKSDLSEESLHIVAENARLHYRVTYVEIPLGLKFRGGSNEDSRFKFFVEAPVFTLGFVSKAVGDIRGAITADDEKIRSDVNGLSLSWGLGLGAEYEFASSGTLVAGLGFQKQFTDLTRDAGTIQKVENGESIKEDSKGSFGAVVLKLGVFF